MHFCPSPTVQSFEFILLSPVRQYFIPPSPLTYMKILPLLHGILLPKASPPDLHLVLLFPIALSNAKDLHLVLLFPAAQSNAEDLHLVLLFPIALSNAQDLHLVLLFPVAQSNAVEC